MGQEGLSLDRKTAILRRLLCTTGGWQNRQTRQPRMRMIYKVGQQLIPLDPSIRLPISCEGAPQGVINPHHMDPHHMLRGCDERRQDPHHMLRGCDERRHTRPWPVEIDDRSEHLCSNSVIQQSLPPRAQPRQSLIISSHHRLDRRTALRRPDRACCRWCLPPSRVGSACCYWNGYGTQCNHPAQGRTEVQLSECTAGRRRRTHDRPFRR